jgi:hypothetical protein|tara:strand:+ start:9663 stop:9959 length:297 start_codon:yes stop_codon:yes gene_type:complete
MESRDLLKNRLREGLEHYDRNTIVIGLLNKSLDRFKDGYRELESAIQFCDDQELRAKLEEIKMMYGHDIEISGDFKVNKPTVLSLLVDIIKNHSPDGV